MLVIHNNYGDEEALVKTNAMGKNFKWYWVVLHSIYKQRLTPEGQPINEKPEEIKLGAEHEGEDGE